MHLVIADTSPIHYLILIGHVEILPRLFDRVVIPNVVLAELSHELAPEAVRRWAAAAPAWLDVVESPPAITFSAGVHKGEAAAIALACLLHADLLLIDDRRGVIAAERQGLNVTGTLGILDVAAGHGLLDFAQAVSALKVTTFRMPSAILGELLNKHGGSGEL